MALTSTALYSAITVGTGSSRTKEYNVTQLLPQVTALTGNAVVFNFVVVTGSTTPGQNGRIVFNYGFAMATYDATAASKGIISANQFDVRFPSAPSTTLDLTTQMSIPIIGNNLYYWLNVTGLIAPITLSIGAVPVPNSNQVFCVK